MPWTSRPLRPLFDNVVCHYQVLKKLTSSSNSCCWRRKKHHGIQNLISTFFKEFFSSMLCWLTAEILFPKPFFILTSLFVIAAKTFYPKIYAGVRRSREQQKFCFADVLRRFFLIPFDFVIPISKFPKLASTVRQFDCSTVQVINCLTVRVFGCSVVWLIDC